MSSSVDNVTVAQSGVAAVQANTVEKTLAHGAARSATRARNNNFDAIRLVAALLVMVSHQMFFAGRAEPFIEGRTLGTIAVLVFLLISGYLVAESWYRDPHIARFAARRFLRIWPALAVATFVIALAGVALTTVPVHQYFGHAWWRFVGNNLRLRVTYQLPGVFMGSQAPAMRAVNGSWWSIPLETKCYLYLAIFGLIGLRRRWLSVIALIAVVALYVGTLPGHPHAQHFHNIELLCTAFFLTGMCARQFRADLARFRFTLLGLGVAVFLAALFAGLHDLVLWVVLAPLVLMFGSVSTPWVRSAGRFGDLSYGTYIYAYFIQQLSVRYWPGGHAVVASIVVAMLATLVLAWCSWHAVEAPALRLKRHLRHWAPDGAP